MRVKLADSILCSDALLEAVEKSEYELRECAFEIKDNGDLSFLSGDQITFIGNYSGDLEDIGLYLAKAEIETKIALYLSLHKRISYADLPALDDSPDLGIF